MYVEKIYEALVKDYNRRQMDRINLGKDFNTLHVSEVISPCHLRVWYDRFVTGMELPQSYVNVVEHGNILHDVLESFLTMEAPFVKSEVELSKTYIIGDKGINVIGKADIIDEHNGFVVDLKTTSPYAFQRNDIRSQYIWQINLYMDMARIPRGYIVTISKSNLRNKVIDLESKEHRVDFDPELTLKLIAKGIKLSEELENASIHGENTLPGVEETEDYLIQEGLIQDREFSSWLCNYCVYKDICPKAKLK